MSERAPAADRQTLASVGKCLLWTTVTVITAVHAPSTILARYNTTQAPVTVHSVSKEASCDR